MQQVEYKEVVLVEDLAPVIRRVLDRRQRVWEEENSTMEGRTVIAPLTALAEESKVPERRIYAILKGETVAVDLDIADRLLLACGMFVELEIPEAIFPAHEIRMATLEQTSMLPMWAQARGIAVPPPGKARRDFGQQMRKRAQAEAAA